MANEFAGKVVMVTGANGNVGQAVARRFATAGAKVVLVGRSEKDLADIAKEIGGMVGVADVTDPASMDAVFLDPPFDSVLFEAALQAAGRVVAADGFVYLEAPILWTDAQLEHAGLKVHRHLKAGAVHAHLLKPLLKPLG